MYESPEQVINIANPIPGDPSNNLTGIVRMKMPGDANSIFNVIRSANPSGMYLLQPKG